VRDQRAYRIINNCDSDGPLREAPPPMTEAQFLRRINLLEGTQVDCFNYCVCAGDMVAFYPSKVTDRITDQAPPGTMDCADNLRAFLAEGKDPVRMHAKRARELDMDFFASVRLNDSHQKSQPDGPFASPFWKNHPEYRNWEVTDGACYYNATLNFKYPEVRERRMNVIREVIETYDMDGIELDFGRNPYLFNPSEAWELRHVATEFVREARELADRHRRRVMIRVPYYEEDLRNGGIDLAEWMRERLADIFIVSCLRGNDTLADLSQWVSRAHESRVQVYGGIEMNIADNAPAHNHNTVSTPDDLRGIAFNHHAQGVDGVALFNFADLLLRVAHQPAARNAYLQTLHQIGSADTLRGTKMAFPFYKHLPIELEVGRPAWCHQTVPFAIASEEALCRDVRIQMDIANAPKPSAFRFFINDRELPSGALSFEMRHDGLARGGQAVAPARSGYVIGPRFTRVTLAPPAGFIVAGENRLGIVLDDGPLVEHTYIKVYELEVHVLPQLAGRERS